MMTIDEARSARLNPDPAKRGQSMMYHNACDWCGHGESEYTSSGKYVDEHICRDCMNFRDDNCTEEEIWRKAG